MQGLANFFCKVLNRNISGFVGMQSKWQLVNNRKLMSVAVFQ